MLRKSLLWLSTRPRVGKFVRTNRLSRFFASRFVAGETPETAVAAARGLEARGITASVDVLGESVREASAAEAAAGAYLVVLEQQAAAGVECNVSVKPTQMGLDLDAGLCERNFRRILDCASRLGGFVRLDMESSEYTERTLALFGRLHE